LKSFSSGGGKMGRRKKLRMESFGTWTKEEEALLAGTKVPKEFQHPKSFGKFTLH
jgi:hypothetical protein